MKKEEDYSKEITPIVQCKNSNLRPSKGFVKSENAIFNQITNEVVSDLNMFSTRVLNRIFGDVDGTNIVTIYDEMLLTNTIIKKQFLHQKELSATTTYNNVFATTVERDYFPSKNTHQMCSYDHDHYQSSQHQNIQPTSLVSLSYQTPKLLVDLTYLIIRLTTVTWDSLGLA